MAAHGYNASRAHESPSDQFPEHGDRPAAARRRHAVRCVCRRVFASYSRPGVIPRLVAFLVLMRSLTEHRDDPELDDRTLARDREERAQRRRAGSLGRSW